MHHRTPYLFDERNWKGWVGGYERGKGKRKQKGWEARRGDREWERTGNRKGSKRMGQSEVKKGETGTNRQGGGWKGNRKVWKGNGKGREEVAARAGKGVENASERSVSETEAWRMYIGRGCAWRWSGQLNVRHLTPSIARARAYYSAV